MSIFLKYFKNFFVKNFWENFLKFFKFFFRTFFVRNFFSFFYEIFNFLIFAIVNMEKKLRNSPKNFFFYIFIFLKNWIFFLKIFLQAVERLKFFYFYTFFLVFFIKFPIKKICFFRQKQQKVQKNVKKRQKNVKKAPFFTLFFLLVFY